jgi:sec-independent protein translocase protein TatB
MFDISWGELLVIGVVALIVIGPHQLPGTLRGLGRAVNKLRGMASDFRTQFDDAMREAELHDVAKDVSDIKSAATGGFNPVETIRNEIKGAVEELKAKASDAASLSEVQSSLSDISSSLDHAMADMQAAAQIDAVAAPHVMAQPDLAPPISPPPLPEQASAPVKAPAPTDEAIPPAKPPRRKKPAPDSGGENPS